MSDDKSLLKNQVAIITGSASKTGIGYATAKLFAQHGCSLGILDLEHTNPTQVAQEFAEEFGTKHCGIVCDVTKHAQCETAVTTVMQELGKIDILINNAGVSLPNKLLDISEEDYDRIMDIHMRSCFWFCKLVIPHMQKNKKGSIVNLSSISAIRGGGIFGSSIYSSAKAGIIGLTRALAREFGPDQIRVNAVAPGFMNTPITASGVDETMKQELARTNPMRRIGSPIDTAKVLLFLASDLAGYVTAETIKITGGSDIS